MEKKNTKIFIIYGKARHGKDTVAGIIEEYYKNEKVINLQISSSLKEYAKKISGWDGMDNETKTFFMCFFISEGLHYTKLNTTLLCMIIYLYY